MTDSTPTSRSTREVPCESWEQFKEKVRSAYAEHTMGSHLIFRGHARSDWKLASQWERKLATWRDRELGANRSPTRLRRAPMLEKILGDFKELAVGLPGIRSRELTDELDWWAVGRHYGLVTPLLDWTRSPYVAAFFAFSGLAEDLSPGVTTRGDIDPRSFLQVESDQSVTIWAFQISEIAESAQYLQILNPQIDIGHRQRAQRGSFTRLDHDEHYDIEGYLSSFALEEPLLTKYSIPGSETAKAITELRMMNITFATLFPDLEGAALQANFEAVSLAFMALSMVRRK